MSTSIGLPMAESRGERVAKMPERATSFSPGMALICRHRVCCRPSADLKGLQLGTPTWTSLYPVSCARHFARELMLLAHLIKKQT